MFQNILIGIGGGCLTFFLYCILGSILAGKNNDAWAGLAIICMSILGGIIAVLLI